VIAVVGEALIDAHRDGDLLHLFPGGGPFNTAIALGRLGVPACFLGAISEDRLGRQLEETLRSAGVDTSRVVRVDAPTPVAIVDPTSGEPSYSFYLAGTAHQALRQQDLEDLSDDVAALHIGTLALATDPPASAISEFAEREGRLRTLAIDPNIRPALISDRVAYLRRFEHLASVADLVKLSGGDLDWLYPDSSARDAVRRLLTDGAGCVVLTHGTSGAQGWTAGASARVTAPAVTVVDTVGAGDAFGAGLLAWLWRCNRLGKRTLRHLDAGELEAALAYAAAVAAAQCTRASAWGPTSADVERLLAETGVPSGESREENEWHRSSSTA
jgi:fructokinase